MLLGCLQKSMGVLLIKKFPIAIQTDHLAPFTS